MPGLSKVLCVCMEFLFCGFALRLLGCVLLQTVVFYEPLWNNDLRISLLVTCLVGALDINTSKCTYNLNVSPSHLLFHS